VLNLYRVIIVLSSLILLLVLCRLLLNVDYIGIVSRRSHSRKRLRNYSNILREQRRKEIIKAKPTLKERLLKRVALTIELSESKVKLQRFISYSILCSSLGAIIGMLLRNPLLMIILGALTSSIPFLYMYNRARAKFLLIESMLPSVMGIIIAQYLHESDIIIAIEKKLDQIPQPLNKYFMICVNEVQALNKDTVTALRNLGDRVDNYYFKEFIKLAIQAEEQGQDLKYTMVTIPEDMRDVQQEQEKFDLIRRKYNREFIATLIFMPLNLMILRFGYKDYYDLLIFDVRGKLSLGLIVLILIFMSYKQYLDNKPIKIELD